ncbi:hypothetical protein HID58_060554 [Brassica napus]|uniref:Uncharacterized protein n=1 Tax=Brassica napus TaxID=3708 RepID=A0ABQ7ZW98_BRANA|nr:hypothetical protein HID58_060554 [Brassica napus]
MVSPIMYSLKMSLSASPIPQTGVLHSIFESLRLGRSSQNIASGLLHFWISLNFKKESEFMGITIFFLDEKDSDLTKETTRVVIRLLVDP